MKAWFHREPWNDAYELRLAAPAGSRNHVATGITEQGDIIWTTVDEMAQVPVFIRNLSPDVVEAIVRSASEITQASDATQSHLKDAISIRDRLLTLVEGRWSE